MEAASRALPYRERPATAATIATAPTARPRPRGDGRRRRAPPPTIRPHGAAAAVEVVPPPGRLVNMVIRDGEVISAELLCWRATSSVHRRCAGKLGEGGGVVEATCDI